MANSIVLIDGCLGNPINREFIDKIAPHTLKEALSYGFRENFAEQLSAVCVWLSLMNREDKEDVKKMLKKYL